MRAFRVLPLAIVLAALAACSGNDLTTPKGEVFAFNPGAWQPSVAEMIVPAKAQP